MIVINFGHPFSAGLVEVLESKFQENVTVRTIRVQADMEAAFGPQAKVLVEAVGLKADEWQTERFAVSLPGLSALAALVVAEIHGRSGYFPTVVRLKPLAGATPPQFVFAEIVDLHVVRNCARMER